MFYGKTILFVQCNEFVWICKNEFQLESIVIQPPTDKLVPFVWRLISPTIMPKIPLLILVPNESPLFLWVWLSYGLEKVSNIRIFLAKISGEKAQTTHKWRPLFWNKNLNLLSEPWIWSYFDEHKEFWKAKNLSWGI